MAKTASRGGRAEARHLKLRQVAARLFLKRGYDGVSIDQIVEEAGGSKSTVYSEFGGKCGLFISSIEELCRESNEPLATMDYSGLGLEASLKKIGQQILKQATAKRAIELQRLAVGEAPHCPEVGEAWYTHGPVRRVAYIRAILDRHRSELRDAALSNDTLAMLLHDAWTGDIVTRILTGNLRRVTDFELAQKADGVVESMLGETDKVTRRLA